MPKLLLIPLDDTVVFPTMDIHLPVDATGEDRVLLVPRHEGDYAKVGTISTVADTIRLPGGGRGVSLEGVARGDQLMPKPEHLTWEEAASMPLVNCTAYRMLVSPHGATMRQGDVVLVWGAGGGLGGFALQHVLAGGGYPVCVVSSEAKAQKCREAGAEWIIDRAAEDYRFWDPESGQQNPREHLRLGKKIRELTGGEDPDIVFEHVGSATFFTSVFVCRTFGKIVTCGATSGFSLTFDVRYLWMRQKTIIGSHFANAYQAYRANQLIAQRKILPVLSRTFPFEACPEPHQMMRENAHLGKMVVLVGAEA